MTKTAIRPAFGTAALLGLGLVLLLAAGASGPIAQPLDYHNFADGETLLGIPNMWNVVSNAPFAIVGLLGCLWLIQTGSKSGAFAESWERRAYYVFFVGELLTCFGSAYYHWNANNSTMVWDRLALSLLLTSFFTIVVTEFVSARAGRLMLAPAVLLGVFSVLQWSWSESLGQGDMRLYLFVQFYPVLAAPLILWLYRSRYTVERMFAWTWGLFVVAKVLEVLDQPIFQATGFMSGHALKHFVAAAATYCLLYGLQRRGIRNASSIQGASI